MSVMTAATTTHPLAQLSASEVTTAREVLVAADLIADTTRFVYVGLEDPDKATLYSKDPVVDRRVRVLLHDIERPSRDVVVSVTGRTVVADRQLDAAVDGQLPVLDEEFAIVEEV